jgi:hypothetical protein
MKTYGGVEVQLRVFLPRLYMVVSDQLHAPAILPPGKEPRYQFDRLGGPQSRSGRGGEERKSVPARNRTPVHQSVHVTVLTELPQHLTCYVLAIYTS